MIDDVKAAAERRRRYKTSMNTGERLEYEAVQLLSDAELLADAYLAEHPADEDQGIDEAWLRSVGFEYVEGRDDGLPLFSSPLNGSRGKYGLVMIAVNGTFVHLHINEQFVSIPNKKTRGDVRRLFIGFGFTLKESK